MDKETDKAFTQSNPLYDLVPCVLCVDGVGTESPRSSVEKRVRRSREENGRTRGSIH